MNAKFWKYDFGGSKGENRTKIWALAVIFIPLKITNMTQRQSLMNLGSTQEFMLFCMVEIHHY